MARSASRWCWHSGTAPHVRRCSLSRVSPASPAPRRSTKRAAEGAGGVAQGADTGRKLWRLHLAKAKASGRVRRLLPITIPQGPIVIGRRPGTLGARRDHSSTKPADMQAFARPDSAGFPGEAICLHSGCEPVACGQAPLPLASFIDSATLPLRAAHCRSRVRALLCAVAQGRGRAERGVGGYKLEGAGIPSVHARGGRHSTILGLPLIARCCGLLAGMQAVLALLRAVPAMRRRER